MPILSSFGFGSFAVTTSRQGADARRYFYEAPGGGDWSTVGDWYKNQNHTIASTAIPDQTNNTIILSDCTANLDDQYWVFPGHVYIATGKKLTLHSTQTTHPVWPGNIDIDGPGTVIFDGVDNGA